ncbi:hypothetical protein EX895_002659 [Sporisorium graminicola]|uniref:Uncharacterized protein n=1 Tax=Sporisorium graminicola TaxID=280036 RepID=A0A4U7KVX2_9BASI|nr:hypothetical protein EX895_002659 [Sporisorium graminicola]TKY88307.1 hypothetical protein EX895_002659 [Sporisorium graminicola]
MRNALSGNASVQSPGQQSPISLHSLSLGGARDRSEIQDAMTGNTSQETLAAAHGPANSHQPTSSIISSAVPVTASAMAQAHPSSTADMPPSRQDTLSEAPAYSDTQSRIDPISASTDRKSEPSPASSPFEERVQEHRQHDHIDADRASLLPQSPAHAASDHTGLANEIAYSPDAPAMAALSSHAASHAPSYSDLFFDLLFAACLNTYSNAVSLERFRDVAAFLGYFTALWWAWWSQAYFDVRYRRPSHHQPYLFKSCQRVVRVAVLGLWVAFSTTPSEFARGSFTNFSQIYGASRFALALDHVVVLAHDAVLWRRGRSNPRRADMDGGRHHSFAGVAQTHLVSIVSLVASGLLWILSRFLRHNGITAPLLVMWIVGIVIEAAAQIVNEVRGSLSPLGRSVLPERLILFGLIILGEGFTGIAETLNKISPGAKLRNEATGGAAIESGGWGADTILQTVSCVLIVILQFAGYFHRATSQIDLNSVLVVLWAYIHVVLHMASALLVIGLKKILSFMNTLNAIESFGKNINSYVMDAQFGQNLTEQGLDQLDDLGSSPLSVNGTWRGLLSILAVIQSNDGANVPSLSEAQRLVDSVVGLAGGNEAALKLVAQANATDASSALSSQFAPSLVLPFRSYFGFADNVINPDSLAQYVDKSLFQFKYIYVASAVYLTIDIVIKTMQSSRHRQLRSFRWAMALRFGFAVMLVLLQVVFTVYDGPPSGAALDGAIAICAAVLLAELVAQQLVDGLRRRLDRPRTRNQRAKRRWRKASRSSLSGSQSVRRADEDIEMETHLAQGRPQKFPSYSHAAQG